MQDSNSDKFLKRHPVHGYKLSAEGGRLPSMVWLRQRISYLQERIVRHERQLQEHLLPAEPLQGEQE